jgi:Spy/CpxP family protein refolding chaperone
MKTKVTLLALAWLASGVAFAADTTTATTPPARVAPGPDMDRLALLLDLNAYQKTEVEKILKEQHEQMRAEFESARASGAARPSRDEMKAKREQAKTELNTKLSAVLDETQLKKFDALRERGPGPGRGFGKHDRGAKDDSASNSSSN